LPSPNQEKPIPHSGLASANQAKPAFHRKLQTPTRRVESPGQTLYGEKGDAKPNFLQMAFPNAVFIGTLAVLYESNAVFLMSVDRDAATEPRKTDGRLFARGILGPHRLLSVSKRSRARI